MNEENIIDIMWKRIGFKVTCNKCGSDQIIIENTIGCSDLSGCWGSVDLECTKCENSGEVYEP